MSAFKTKPLAVVIPVKDNFEGLKKTLEAIWLDDRLVDGIEIAVIDAGTCAETSQWLLLQDHRIEHIRSAKDNGVYDAMNYGKNTVNATWIWFLGAGDVPEQEALHAVLEDIGSWDSEEIHVHGVGINNPEHGVPSHYPARWDQSMIWRNTTHHQGVLYSSELLEAHQFNTDHRVLADYGLHLDLYQKGIKAHLHPETICTVESGGISRRFDANLYREEWNVKKTVLKGPIKWVHPFWLILKYCFKKTRWPAAS